ncbi:MAG: hypothetical protein WD230_03875 [Cucumibacter sp.]
MPHWRSRIISGALYAAIASWLMPGAALGAPGDIEVETPVAEPGAAAPAVPSVNGEFTLPEGELAGNAVVYRDLSRLPAPVAAKRESLMAAAATGDVEALRPILAAQENPPTVSFGGTEDPIEYLRFSSTDGEGRELLGIMLELLEAPFAVLDEGTEDEIFVWPYLAAVPLEDLSPPELVELYKLVSHHDYEDMLNFGGWYFFRVGILANGEWAFFVAGD